MSTAQKQNIGQNKTSTAGNPVVSHYPLSSVLVVVGLGLAVGVAVGSFLGGPFTPRPSLGQRTGLAAEKLGRRMLDSIAGVLPESISKHIA